MQSESLRAPTYVGRLAPSPTGAQHVGNARTFLIAWLRSRLSEGTLLYRLEDLDTPRTKTWAAEQAAEDLNWLGLDWDNRSVNDQVVQSQRSERYSEVLMTLQRAELVYPCTCSRQEIESSASAPHESTLDGVVYPGTCASRSATDAETLEAQDTRYAWRFRMPTGPVQWHDTVYGKQSLEPASELGDFVVARNYGGAAYQLAVVVDDHDSGITEVVRGSDLIYSTYRQLALYRALGWQPPRWFHTPLVVGPDGLRLAKRHGDSRLAHYREQVVAPERIIGCIAYSMGWIDKVESVSTHELLSLLRSKPDWIECMPREPWMFTRALLD